ncbi:MAG: PilN domain-containing protein [Candidatus Omnitrophica bacterium]|nr:PilN domain-containing protein [Candidatus Omnitrophota bacterium]
MIEINLLPEELREKEPSRIVLPDIPIKKTAVAAIGIFAAIQILLFVFAFYQRLELFATRREIQSLTLANKTIAAEKSETAAVQAKLKQIQVLTTRKFYWASLLNAVSDSMTRGVWLRNLGVEPAAQNSRILKMEGSVVGAGQETAYVGKFIKELKAHPLLGELFSEIQLSTMNQKKIKEFDVYDFTLVCAFRKDKA